MANFDLGVRKKFEFKNGCGRLIICPRMHEGYTELCRKKKRLVWVRIPSKFIAAS